jgi:hypothetical protein
MATKRPEGPAVTPDPSGLPHGKGNPMIRTALTIPAIMVAGVYAAPLAAANPTDSQFCSALNDQLAGWEIAVDKCDDLARAAHWQCNYLGKTGDYERTVQEGTGRWGWQPAISSIITTNAVAAFCPDNTSYLPDAKNAPSPSGNEGRTGRSV